jgi:glycosyltransferase involved in cell wall biosynthesis
MQPLVSVVCLCYNHERFVREAVESVLNQSYQNIQIIVVDDMSSDGSRSVITELVNRNPNIEIVFPSGNVGNCAAFNLGLRKVKGEFVVDFATDDVMVPDRIARQMNFFNTLDSSFGVVFSDADYIDEDGKFIRHHFDYLKAKRLLGKIPQGDVYKDLVSTYFVPSPTMLVRMKVMDELNGYDENLVYEDFDFWIRSGRKYKYAFQNERLTKIRKTQRSMSTGWYKQGDAQLHSTYLVCKKIISMNRTDEEDRALAVRLKYEIRQSVFSNNKKEAKLFFDMLLQIGQASAADRFLMILARIPIDFSVLRSLYHRLRFH